MMKVFAVGVLGAMLCFVAPNPAASQEAALSGDEVQKLFQDSTEVGQGLKHGEDTGRRWQAFYDADGTARKREGEATDVIRGTWFVDDEGRHCFTWEHKEQIKCDVIVPEGASYLRIRDGDARGRIRIEKGNPAKL